MKKLRQSNFELLRIVAMLMIVAHHFSVHSLVAFPTAFSTINRVWIQLISMGGKIGVNIFVMISGYFLINTERIKWSKILTIWWQLVFYAVLIYIIFASIGRTVFEWNEFQNMFFPIGTKKWWFASTYLVLYIFVPYINIVLRSIKKQQLEKMLFVVIILWCIMPTFTDYTYDSNRLLWFVFLYCIGGYIKLYGFFEERFKLGCKGYIILSVVLILMNFVISACYDYRVTKSNLVVTYAEEYYGMHMLLMVLISLFLFLGFEKMQIKHSSIINTISSTTFGVYLIHDEGTFVRMFLWNELLPSRLYTKSVWFVLYSVVVILGVFAIASIVELIRIYLLEKPFIKTVDKVKNKLKVDS